MIATFAYEEFKEAIFYIQTEKYPGPDGLNSGFYQHFWETFGPKMFSVCCSLLKSGVFQTSLIMTNIYLTPKCEV